MAHHPHAVVDCSACGSAAAPGLCTGCHSVAYCDAACQSKHWGAHATDCAARAPLVVDAAARRQEFIDTLAGVDAKCGENLTEALLVPDSATRMQIQLVALKDLALSGSYYGIAGDMVEILGMFRRTLAAAAYVVESHEWCRFTGAVPCHLVKGYVVANTAPLLEAIESVIRIIRRLTAADAAPLERGRLIKTAASCWLHAYREPGVEATPVGGPVGLSQCRACAWCLTANPVIAAWHSEVCRAGR